MLIIMYFKYYYNLKKMRYYSNEYPKLNDLVTVTVSEVTDNGVYVKLTEYDGAGGYILPTEIAKYKVNVNKMFLPDKNYTCVVLSIDEKKQYINLSYKRVLAEDKTKHELNFPFKQKIVQFGNELIKLFPDLNDEIAFKNTIWKLFDNITEINSTAETEANITEEKYYRSLLENPQKIFEFNEEVLAEVIESYLANIKSRINVSNIIMAKEIKLIIIENDAVYRLKEILDSNNFNDNVKIEYVSSPKYKIIVDATDENNANDVINSVIEKIKEKASKYYYKITIPTENVIVKQKNYALKSLKNEKNEMTN
jgi:translation initiation factor 2 alpha subunit (eIF-2alpha)